MKLVAISDIHVHPYRQFSVNNSRMEHCLSSVRDAFRVAHENGASYILFTGDWFHELNRIPTNALTRSIETLRDLGRLYEGISIIGISGNHDQYGRNTIDTPSETALQALASSCSNFTLFDYNYDVFGFGQDSVQIFGIPYMEFPEDFYRVLERMVPLIDKNIPSVLMMHQVPNGNEDNIPSQVDPKHPLLKHFDTVLNGHIHRHQYYPSTNLITVGSPLHHDLGDIGQQKGILLVDTGKFNFSVLPTTYPQFRRVKFGEEIPEGWRHDYIVTDPPPLEDTPEGSMDRFSVTNTPRDIIMAYGERMGMTEEQINVGLNLLHQP